MNEQDSAEFNAMLNTHSISARTITKTINLTLADFILSSKLLIEFQGLSVGMSFLFEMPVDFEPSGGKDNEPVEDSNKFYQEGRSVFDYHVLRAKVDASRDCGEKHQDLDGDTDQGAHLIPRFVRIGFAVTPQVCDDVVTGSGNNEQHDLAEFAVMTEANKAKVPESGHYH